MRQHGRCQRLGVRQRSQQPCLSTRSPVVASPCLVTLTIIPHFCLPAFHHAGGGCPHAAACGGCEGPGGAHCSGALWGSNWQRWETLHPAWQLAICLLPMLPNAAVCDAVAERLAVHRNTVGCGAADRRCCCISAACAGRFLRQGAADRQRRLHGMSSSAHGLRLS